MAKKVKKTTRKRVAKKVKKAAAAESSGGTTAEADAKAPPKSVAPTGRKKKARRKTASTRSTKKAAKAAAGSGPQADVTAESKSTAPVKRKARRTRKKAKRAAPAVTAEADSPNGAAVTRHEADDGSIVIRFPPVAQPPFASGTAPAGKAEAPVTTEDSADQRPATAPPDGEVGALTWDEVTEVADVNGLELSEGSAFIVDEQPMAPVETARTEAAEPDKLTRSQKRRLRRKRRHDGKAADKATESADAQVAVTPEDVPDAKAAATEPDDEPAEKAAAPAAKAKRRRGRRRKSRDRTAEAEAGPVVAAETAVAEEEEVEPETEEELEEASEEEDEPVGKAPSAGHQEMIINFLPRDECRIAIIENGKLEEIYLERASYENHVGSIYKGLVTNVESSIQAAFVDFGLGKNGFLHITDLNPDYFPSGGSVVEKVGRKMPRRARPPIQKCLRRGQELVVQITKEGIGTKGPTLSTYLSIPGRFLVMMPGMHRLGISRKIEDDDNRQKLRAQLTDLELPEGIGFIARTAARAIPSASCKATSITSHGCGGPFSDASRKKSPRPNCTASPTWSSARSATRSPPTSRRSSWTIRK